MSKNGVRKYFMPNRPLATPDYNSDSFCSVENDNSDKSSSNSNINNHVNANGNTASREDRQH